MAFPSRGFTTRTCIWSMFAVRGRALSTRLSAKQAQACRNLLFRELRLLHSMTSVLYDENHTENAASKRCEKPEQLRESHNGARTERVVLRRNCAVSYVVSRMDRRCKLLDWH